MVKYHRRFRKSFTKEVTVKMPLSGKITSLTELVQKLPQKKIAQLLSVLLLCYIAYLFAQLTWLLVPQAKLSNGAAHSIASKNSTYSMQKVNLAKIQALNLFGLASEKPAEKVVEIKDAPETRLNLTLSGVVASEDATVGSAIIENNGKQDTYGIGDIIEGTRATLAQVFSDRVLIKQTGQLETLMLDGFKYAKMNSAQLDTAPAENLRTSNDDRNNDDEPAQIEQIDQRNNEALNDTVANLKADLSEDPGKITDYLKISPQRENGVIIGYRLMPGANPEFFTAAGLIPGDIAIKMNGMDLTDAQESMQALATLRDEAEIALTIDRNGELTELLFSITN